MPFNYDIETDAFYLRGKEKAGEALDYFYVNNLLLLTDFDDARIARLARVTLAFVQKVKEERPHFEAVKTFCLEQGLKDKKIASLANIPFDFVEKVRLILELKN